MRGYWGFVGFPRHKRVVDCYARCLMYKVDISIAGRGLHNLWGHWKGLEHTRLEQKYRNMTQRPLLDKSCRPVIVGEHRRVRLERMVEPPVYLESPLGLSVDEHIAIEKASAQVGVRSTLTAKSGVCLWLCSFVNSFTTVSTFEAVMAQLEHWAVAMQTEMTFDHRLSNNEQCQVCMTFLLSSGVFLFFLFCRV